MATLKELTITYSRKNQIRDFEPEEIFLALKFSMESQDQGTKAVKDTINHGLDVLTDRIDDWCHPGAKELSRHITVKDQNGKALGVPDKHKGEKGEEGTKDEAGVEKNDPPPAPSETDSIEAKELTDAEEKAKGEYAALFKKYGDNAPLVIPDLTQKPIGTGLVCSFEDKDGMACRGDLYDNRNDLKTAKSPHFKCKKNKKHAVWPR